MAVEDPPLTPNGAEAGFLTELSRGGESGNEEEREVTVNGGSIVCRRTQGRRGENGYVLEATKAAHTPTQWWQEKNLGKKGIMGSLGRLFP